MKNCFNNCENNKSCIYFKEILSAVGEGLGNNQFSATENDNTTYAYEAIFSATARSCEYYDTINKEVSSEDKSILDRFVLNLKKDKVFIQEFLESKSPEHRKELVSEYFDLEVDNWEIDDDLYEDYRFYIFSQFGY